MEVTEIVNEVNQSVFLAIAILGILTSLSFFISPHNLLVTSQNWVVISFIILIVILTIFYVSFSVLKKYVSESFIRLIHAQLFLHFVFLIIVSTFVIVPITTLSQLIIFVCCIVGSIMLTISLTFYVIISTIVHLVEYLKKHNLSQNYPLNF